VKAVRASAAALIALALAGCAGQGLYAATPVVTIPAGTATPDPRVGVTVIPSGEREAAVDISGETAERTPLSTRDMRGDIVVVNAWASWCAPCIEELPLLDAAALDFAGEDVTFLGVNSLDDPVAAAGLLATSRYRSIDDRDGSVLARIPGVPPRALPSTVILDREGRVAVRIIGPVQPGQLEDAITRLLDEVA